MGLQSVYKSIALEKDKKSFLKAYHVDLDTAQLLINFEISEFDFETEAQNIVESLLEIVQKHLTETEPESIYERFEESLKEVNFFLNDLKSKKESGNIGKINAVLGVLESTTLHITKTGLSECYLLRKGNLIEISEGLYTAKSSDPNYFVNIASGDLEAGDKILFSSKRLLKFVPKSDLISMFMTSDMDGSFQELQNTLNLEITEDMLVNGVCLEKQPSHASAKTEEKMDGFGAELKPSAKTGQNAAWAQDMLDKGKSFVANFGTNVKDPVKRKNYIIVAAILLAVVLLFSLTLTFNSQSNNQDLQKYQQILQAAKDRLSDAGRQKLYDTKQAQTSLEEAKNKAVQLANAGVFYNDVRQLLKDIQTEEESMDKIIREDNPVVVVDLSKKDQTVSAMKLVNLNQTFYVVTASSVLGPIVDSAPDSYSQTKVDNGEIFVSADHFADRNDIVILTKSNKLIEFKENNFNFMDTTDTTWKSGIDIKTYSTRQYIYILDPANSNIWRYERTNKNYKGAVGYNIDKVDLKDAVSLAIDGNVYILKKNGEVKRLYSQKLQNFTIDGGPSVPLKDLDTTAKIYTNENLRNIYILDPKNERVLVYKKATFENPVKMTYDRQYVFKDQELRDMYVDDTESSLYALTPTRILKVDAKALQ